MRQRNQDRDLSRIVGFEQIVLKHYVDCLILDKYVTFPSRLLDVGTGAGFPGIPLKIQHPEIEIILAEPRPRRVEFLKETIRDLRLTKTTVFDHKVTSQSFNTPMPGIITRALETIDKTLLRTSGCIDVGSQYFFMKGPNADEELKQALREFSHIRVRKDYKFTLPHSTQHRRLIVLECHAKPEGKLRRDI